MQKICITRRKLIKTLLALGAGSVFFSTLPAAVAADDSKIWALFGDSLPPPETFAALSTFITLHDDLDADSMQRMYKVFMDEPWAPEHIKSLHKKISRALGDGNKTLPRPEDKSWKFNKGESWFMDHLLTTWYLGIYYHQERPTQRILYETALEFRATKGSVATPYVENVGYGAWTKAPEGVE